VTVCDIAAVPLDDASADIAILSLALMARTTPTTSAKRTGFSRSRGICGSVSRPPASVRMRRDSEMSCPDLASTCIACRSRASSRLRVPSSRTVLPATSPRRSSYAPNEFAARVDQWACQAPCATYLVFPDRDRQPVTTNRLSICLIHQTVFQLITGPGPSDLGRWGCWSSALIRRASASWSSRMMMRHAESSAVPWSISSRARAARRSW